MHFVHVFPSYVLVKEIPIKGHFEDVAGESVDVGEFPSLDGRILPKKSELRTNVRIYLRAPAGQKSLSVENVASKACQTTRVANLMRQKVLNVRRMA